MRTSTRTAVAVGLALVGSLALTGGAEAGIEQREWRQQARIRQGIASGELTRREAIRLESNAAAIERQERAMRHSGAGLTPCERARLNRRLDAQSARIYEEKHDAARRR